MSQNQEIPARKWRRDYFPLKIQVDGEDEPRIVMLECEIPSGRKFTVLECRVRKERKLSLEEILERRNGKKNPFTEPGDTK